MNCCRGPSNGVRPPQAEKVSGSGNVALFRILGGGGLICLDRGSGGPNCTVMTAHTVAYGHAHYGRSLV